LSALADLDSPASEWSARTAQLVIVRGINGLKEILALGITAKATDVSACFRGMCHDSTYFLAYCFMVE
jgi:hypothetical protein